MKPAKSVVEIWLWGGPSQLETYIKIEIGSLKHSILTDICTYHLIQTIWNIPTHQFVKTKATILKPAMSRHFSVADISPKYQT